MLFFNELLSVTNRRHIILYENIDMHIEFLHRYSIILIQYQWVLMNGCGDRENCLTTLHAIS